MGVGVLVWAGVCVCVCVGGGVHVCMSVDPIIQVITRILLLCLKYGYSVYNAIDQIGYIS